MNKNRTESESSRGANARSEARGFFERAAERVRSAVRTMGNTTRSRGRETSDDRWSGRSDYRRGLGRFESNLGGGYDSRAREGSIHEPMLEWRERPSERDGSAQGGAQWMGGRGRDEQDERDEQYGRYERRGRGW